MLRTLTITLVLLFAVFHGVPAQAHTDSKFIQGPHGGHIVDAGGGKQHWELVANGGELVLYVTDAEEKPVATEDGKATAQILVGGKTITVAFAPAGDNTMKATGDFVSETGMKVIVKTDKVGGESFQVRFTPLQ